MDDNDLREQREEESLIKDAAKKAISKKIKVMPLSTKLWIIGIIAGIIIYLLIFIVLTSTLSMLFFFNDGDSTQTTTSNLSYIKSNSEDNYWWPIGGAELEEQDGKQYATGVPTSTNITSFFGYRDMNGDGEKEDYHNGIDIGVGTGLDYIIAVAKGKVISVNDNCSNEGYYQNKCGGERGNYVIIEHYNSVYTIYAHLFPNSITVKKGEIVEQGQIIGQMGNSGSSTGTHLHFQMEVGERSSKYAKNPLLYMSPTNTRPITVASGSTSGTNQMLSMLRSWEGTGPTNEDSYIIYDDGGGTLTVGHGVTLKYNVERFQQRGIDVSVLGVGNEIKKTIVDSIELEILNEFTKNVKNTLSNNNITLKDYQVDALIIRAYNTGNISNFPENYTLYGISQELYDNYMSLPNKLGGAYSSGLDRRRQAEWNLFYNGVYTFNA